jgi:ComF family protein
MLNSYKDHVKHRTLNYKRIFIRSMKTVWNAFVDLIFPRYCLGCNDTLGIGEEQICTNCRFDLPQTHSIEHGDEKLEQKFYGKVQTASVNAYLKFVKGGKVQRLLHQLKYKNKPEVGEILGRWYGNELKRAAFQQKIDVIVPVPMHPKKLSVRGYNQAEKIAKGLSEALDIKYDVVALKKGKPTESQTRKTRYERYQNANDVFYVADSTNIAGQRVALVDDVVTTGSTLEICAAELLGAGAAEIHIITIATAT